MTETVSFKVIDRRTHFSQPNVLSLYPPCHKLKRYLHPSPLSRDLPYSHLFLIVSGTTLKNYFQNVWHRLQLRRAGMYLSVFAQSIANSIQGDFFPFFILTVTSLITVPVTYSLLKPSKGARIC